MRKSFHYLLAIGLFAGAPAVSGQEITPQIDYDGFAELTLKLKEIRQERLINLTVFLAKAQQDQAIILDTRSAEAYRLGHIAGAVNVPLSDFTDAKLRNVLGQDTNRPILIYCNNNFSENIAPIVLKRPRLALNIPTFINLHGSGYQNIWELAEVVSIAQVDWVSQPMLDISVLDQSKHTHKLPAAPGT